LFCVAPSEPPCFELRQMAMRRIAHGHVLGRRLLTLKGAGHLPLVLGNDVAGIVEDVGPEVTRFTAGTAVFGVSPPHGVPSPDAGESRRGGGLAALFHDRVAGA
jgi:NADPH:quinone reductase-like Zn-dependent oxidoreductase